MEQIIEDEVISFTGINSENLYFLIGDRFCSPDQTTFMTIGLKEGAKPGQIIKVESIVAEITELLEEREMGQHQFNFGDDKKGKAKSKKYEWVANSAKQDRRGYTFQKVGIKIISNSRNQKQ